VLYQIHSTKKATSQSVRTELERKRPAGYGNKIF